MPGGGRDTGVGSGPAVRAWALCFAEKEAEAAFVQSRKACLRRNALVYFGSLAAFLTVYSTVCVLSGWAMYSDTSEKDRLVTVHSAIMGCGLALTVFYAIAVRSTAFTDSRWMTLEMFVACALFTLVFVTFAQHPWNVSRLCGISDPHRVIDAGMEQDLRLLMFVDLYLTTLPLMLRLRWEFLGGLAFACVVLYLGSIFALGTATPASCCIMNVIFLLLVCSMSLVCRRNLERYERNFFLQVVQERTRRGEAEDRLSEFAHNGTAKLQQKAGAEEAFAGQSRVSASLPLSTKSVGQSRVSASLPLSTKTGEVFNFTEASSPEAVERQLKGIIDLGAREHWLVRAEDLQVIPNGIIGFGGFGLVLRAKLLGVEVVLKAPLRKGLLQTKHLPAVASELRVLRRLRHPNIVGLYGAAIDIANSEVVLVLEQVRGKHLDQAIEGVAGTSFDATERRSLAHDVCSALVYLHGRPIAVIHGDIKASNILIERYGSKQRAKLLDFGLSRVLTRGARRLGGSVRWAAPEVFQGSLSAVSPAADVYSFGRVLFAIMAGRRPFNELPIREIEAAARTGRDLPLDWPPDMPFFSEDSYILAEECLRREPDARPPMTFVQQSLEAWEAVDESQLGEAVGHALLVSPLALQATDTKPDLCAELESARRSLRQHTQTPEQPEAVEAKLVYESFRETPLHSLRASLMHTLASWNVPAQTGCCCEFHEAMHRLQHMVRTMEDDKCCNHCIGDGAWQCRRCLVVFPEYDSGVAAIGETRAARLCKACQRRDAKDLHTI